MKKIIRIVISISLLILVGCDSNIFSSLDKVDENSQEAVSQAKYEAREGINSGDYDTAIKNAEKIIRDYEMQGINNVNDFSDYQSIERDEYIEFQTIKAEANLGKAGVSALDVLEKVYKITSNSDTNNSLIDIVNGIGDGLDNALDSFKKGLPSPEILSPDEKDKLKDVYQTAGIAYGLKTAKLILNTLDTNNDKQINENDYPNPNKKEPNITTNWKKNRENIIRSLKFSISYLSVALNSQKAKNMLNILTRINNQLKKIPDNLSKKALTNISNILTGKEAY